MHFLSNNVLPSGRTKLMKTPSWRVFPVSGKPTNWFEVSFEGLTKNYFTCPYSFAFVLCQRNHSNPIQTLITLKLSFPRNTPKRSLTTKSWFLLLETMRWVPFAMQPSPLKLKEIEPIQPTSIDWWHILDSTWAWQKSLGRVTCPFGGTFCTQFHHFLDGLLTFLYKLYRSNWTIFGVNWKCFLLSVTHRFTKL